MTNKQLISLNINKYGKKNLIRLKENNILIYNIKII